MSNSRVLKTILSGMKKQRPTLNPYASAAAAEVLEGEGKFKDAALVREEIDPTDDQYAMDPMDFWLAVEDLSAAPSD